MPLYLLQSLKLYLRTYPYTLAKFVLNSFFAMAAFLIFFVPFLLSGSLFPGVQQFFLLAAFLAFLLFWHLYRVLFQRPLRAMHIATLAELMKKSRAPSVRAQLSYGLKRIDERFGSYREWLKAHRKISESVFQIERALFKAHSPFPFKPLKALSSNVAYFFKNAFSYVDEMLLVLVFISDDSGVWPSARDGIILFTQRNRKLLSKNILFVFISYLSLALLFLLFAFAFQGLFGSLIVFSSMLLITAFLAALLVYYSFVVPFILCLMVTNFFETVKGDVPRQDYCDGLQRMVPSFKELVGLAGQRTIPISLDEKGLIESWRLSPKSAEDKFFDEALLSHMEVGGRGEPSEQVSKKPGKKREGPFEGLYGKIKALARLGEAGAEKLASYDLKGREFVFESVKLGEDEMRRQALEELIKKVKAKEQTRSLRVLVHFLEQLVQNLGEKNEIELIKIEPMEKFWVAVAKINNDWFEFKLSLEGDVLEFRELEGGGS